MTRTTCLAFCLLLGVGLALPSRAAELNPVSSQPSTDVGPTAGRVIVKFRGNSVTAAAQAKVAADKVSAVAARTGLALVATRRLGAEMQVLEIGPSAAGESFARKVARLRADPEVEFAEPDQRRFAHATPSDTLFPGQWYLQNAVTTPSAVDAISAWDLTTGSSGIVIADLDTGVRFDHPDLMSASLGGRLLPGFDFVSDRSTANDGDGWDPDPSDPGDWVTTLETNTPAFKGCTAGDSSWHGTRTAGIIGALTNNSQGVAGLGWRGWILPARVLGKCGGSDSDIIAAMLWAGGVAVDGAPANPYPARIINMSLGGSGACPQSYRNVINQLAARGVLVVASVGNEGTVLDTPANCPGVAAIGAVRHAGTKVGFSNLGPGVTVSAPGGNCVNTGAGQPCLYSIDTTTNLGTQGPGTNSYTDQFNFNVGTSFSAPIASGIVGLMLAANGQLTTSQLIARLQEGATRPFPPSSDPTIPVCHIPASSSDVQTSECVCTTSTCGAGMANAAGAVRAALRPIAAVSVPANVSPGQNVVLRASGSGAACSHSVASYAWTIAGSSTTPPGIVGANTDTATVVAPPSGSFTVRLTVTDDAGRQDTADVIVTPNAATTSAPSGVTGSACPTTISIPQTVLVAISPTSVSLTAGSGTQAFTATVTNAADTRVNWFVNDIAGGNATVGTITPAGLYTAPATAPNPAKVTVTAVSVADSSRSAAAAVTIVPGASSSGGGGGGGGGSIDLLVLSLLGAALARGPRRD